MSFDIYIKKAYKSNCKRKTLKYTRLGKTSTDEGSTKDSFF